MFYCFLLMRYYSYFTFRNYTGKIYIQIIPFPLIAVRVLCLCNGLQKLPMILVLSLMVANEPKHVAL